MEFLQAWREVWARARLSAPRRQAVRAALDATRAVPGMSQRPAEEIRTALLAELSARGVGDVSERMVPLIVRSVETSRYQASAELAGRGARKAWAEWQRLREHAMPLWLNPPSNAQRLPPGEVDHVMTTHLDLGATNPLLLERLLAEAPTSMHPTDENADASRVFLCWLALDPATPGAVAVHAGAPVLGHLSVDDARLVRPQLVTLADQGKVQTVSAKLGGDTAENIEVALLVPIARPTP